MEMDCHFISYLRKAIVIPKLIVFLMKAIPSHSQPKLEDIVSWLPAYTHL